MKVSQKFPDQSIVGQFRQLGPFGPAYQVTKILKTLNDGDCLVRIHLLESGEETDYRYSRLKNDPEVK